jgi:hypothetical protein
MHKSNHCLKLDFRLFSPASAMHWEAVVADPETRRSSLPHSHAEPIGSPRVVHVALVQEAYILRLDTAHEKN